MAKKWFMLEVAPLTVLPFRKAIYSYQHTEKLPPGTLVTIPFSGRTLQGVVLQNSSATEKQAIELKTILSVEERAALTDKQLVLAREVSAMTFTPLGRVLKHFIPKKAKKKTSTKEVSQVHKYSRTQKDLAKSKKVLTCLGKSDALFLHLSAEQQSLETLLTLLQQLEKKYKGQMLILTPDISTAVRLEKSWESYYSPKELVSLYHTKTPGQYYEAWENIQTGKAKIIIATRHGLFAPFQKLCIIIQLDPSDESYKQWDMSPRYHAEHVIPVLQNIWKAKYIGVGVLPPLSVLKDQLPWIQEMESPVIPEWINLKFERFQKNWGLFSGALESALKQVLSENKQALLYVHQGGLESFSVCQECRTIFRCPNCQSVLKLTLSDRYQCRHCGFKSSLFPQCPECKSIHFKSVGAGTEKVAREVRKIFPGAHLEIADKKHLSDHKKIARFLENVIKKEPDILIATSSYLRFPPLSRVTLVAIIDADILLNLPGYRKDEQFVELIEKAKSVVAHLKGRLLVQSYHPESDLFEKIEKLESPLLLEGFLKERTALHYPPSYRCLTLTARPKLKKGGELLQATTRELKTLLSKAKALKMKTNILVQAAERKEKGKLQKYTLIRYLPPLAPPLTKFLEKKADGVLIDHDPLHIT